MRLALASCVPLLLPSAPPLRSVAPIASGAVTTSRRVALLAVLTTAIAPLPAFADSPLTPSAMLTAGPYLNDLKAARRGLDELKPLIELNEDRGYESVRIEIRKPPVNGIRKACSKLIALLPEGSPIAKAKGKIYEDIKKDLGAIDFGCSPADRLGSAERPDVLALVAHLQSSLDEIGSGLGIKAAEPLQPIE